MIPPVPAVVPVVAEAIEPGQTRTNQVDDELTVTAPEWFEDLETGIITFSGGVTASFGETTLRADSLIVDRNQKRMTSQGDTVIRDPEATVRAESVEIYWQTGQRRGFARNVEIEAGYVRITGSSLNVVTDPEPVWIIENATLELTDLSRGNNRILARRVRLYPRKYGIAEGIIYQILGQRLGPIGSQRFNLDRRVTGFRLPSITNRRGVGLGVSWESSLLLSEKSSIQLAIASFPGNAQEFKAQYTYSPLASERTVTRLAPRDELGERQRDGWFNSVTSPTPQYEFERIADHKTSFSLGTLWNISSVGRLVDGSDISKLAEAAYEWGGPALGGGFLTTTRIQRIREGGGPWVDRGVIDATFLAPRYEFAPGVAGHLRLDAFGTLGKNQYGFVRSELGVIGEPTPGVLLGAAWVVGRDVGEPDFLFDRLDFDSSMHLRADYVVGPYTLRYLAKYDLTRNSWYDREWEIALAAGSLEPFILRREFPTDFRVGVRFRIDAFTRRLEQRSVSR